MKFFAATLMVILSTVFLFSGCNTDEDCSNMCDQIQSCLSSCEGDANIADNFKSNCEQLCDASFDCPECSGKTDCSELSQCVGEKCSGLTFTYSEDYCGSSDDAGDGDYTDGEYDDGEYDDYGDEY